MKGILSMFRKFYVSNKSAEQLNKERTRARNSILNNKELYPDLATQDKATIAGMHSGLLETMESLNNSIFILGSGNKRNTDKSKFKNNEVIGQQVYSRLNKRNFFDDLANLDTLTNSLTKNQTGQELIRNVIKLNEINYNRTTKADMVDFQDLYTSFKNVNNIKANGGNFITYDLETLGGVNSYGHQQFDFITELSATVWNSKDNSVAESINSLLGFSEKEYDNVKRYIEGLQKVAPSNYTEKDKVYLKRLSLLSDSTFDYNMSGFEAHVTKANPDNIEASVENALKGLEAYRDIGKKQELWLTTNNVDVNLEDYKKQYIRKYKDLVYNGIGQNGTYNNYVALGQNTAMFDDKAVSAILNETVEHKAGRSLDTYQAIKYINENLGQSAHIPEGLKVSGEFGIGTQDALKNLFGYDKLATVAAHNAKEDENILYKILFDKNIGDSSYFDFLNNKINSVNTSLENKMGVYKANKRPGVFLMDKTSQKSFNSMDNSLNFIYNPLDKSFKSYDGFRLNEDGKIVKDSFNGFGPKAGALYSQEAYKVDLDKKNWKEVFSNFGLDTELTERFYDKYSYADHLYVLKSQEYKSNDLLNDKFGANNAFEEGPTYFRIITSEKELASAMGTKIGYENTDGTISFDENVLDSLNLKTTKMIDGKVVVEDVDSIEDKTSMLLKRNNYKLTTDSAARTIRDMEYERVAKLRRYRTENNYSMSQTIAELVSKNKSLDINITQNLMDELGWYDYSIKSNKLLPETIAKTTVLDKYAEAIDPILDSIEDVFNEMGLKDSFDVIDKEIDGTTRKIIKSNATKGMKAKKNLLFQNVLTNVLEELTNSPEFVSNAKPSIFTADELNKVDFLRSDLFPEKDKKLMLNSLANYNNKYVSLDLNKNDSILNLFFNNIYGDYDVSKKGNAGFDALFRAYESIGSDKRFHGVWGDLTFDKVKSFQNEGNLSQLNSLMTEKLQSFVNRKREKDSGYGLMFARNIQDYSDVNSIKTLLKYTDPKKLKELVRTNMTNAVDDVYIADSNNSDLINSLVDRYFMPFSETDVNNQIKNLTKDQQTVLKAQYNLSKNEAMSTAKDLVESLKGTDINLGISGKGKDSVMFLQRGNEARVLDMHKYILDNGIINHSINGNAYSTNFTLDVSKIINKNGTVIPNADLKNSIKLTSNVQAVANNSYSFVDTVKFANNSGRDLMDSLIYKVQNNNAILREVGARREAFNYNNTIERAMQINTNSLVSILPELDNAGYIDDINKIFNIDNKSAKDMKSLITKIRDMKARPSEIGDLLASEQNLFYQSYQVPLVSMLKEMNLSPLESVDAHELLNLVNPHLQDTKLAKGMLTLNNSPFSNGAAKFDKSSRSVSNQQGNAILYDKKKLAEDLEFHKKMLKGTKATEVLDNISIGNKITNAASEQFVNNVEDKYTAGLSLKYLQINSDDLKNVFVDDIKKLKKGESNTFSKYLSDNFKNIDVNLSAKYLSEKAMKLSTYEQQSAINARVSYIAMHKNNRQLIKAKKELIINHTDNISVIEANKKAAKLDFIIDKNGNIKYQLGYEVNRGQVLGMFGSEGNVVNSRFEGVFRGRYFDKFGNVVSEQEINELINSNNISKNKDAVRKFLGNKYDFGYEVIQKFEDYGHKLYNDASEKSTADVMDVALGKIDTGLMKTLRKAGYGDLEGKVLSRDYIEEFLKPKLTSELGEDKAKDIYNRMLKERFSFSDMLSEYEIFRGVGQITNLNVFKHESVSTAVADLVENIYRKYKDSPEEAEKQFKALFPGVKIKDGKLFFDDVNNINADLFNKIAARFEEENNKGVGYTGFSHVIHAYDDPSGTYSSNLDIDSLRAKYNNLDKDIRTLQSKETLTPKEAERLKVLQSSITDVDAKINSLSIEKGLKFDNRMNLNLQRSVYNKDSFGIAKENLSAEEYKKYFGHALDANGNISSEYLGKSILDPVTSLMRDEVLIGHGETALSKYTGKKDIGYLKDSFKGMEDTISVEKAEELYSYLQGVRALDYNKTHAIETYKDLTSGSKHSYNNFREIDLSKLSPNDPNGWLDLDIGGQGKTITSAANNPYTENLLIKTGLGGDHEYLAIARTPEKHFEDGLIKESHIQKLSSLQSRLKEVNSLNAGDEKDKAMKSARKIVDDIVNLQKYDLTSKNGLYGDLISTRLKQSFFGKASGLTINSTMPLISNPDKETAATTYKMLKDLNGESFLDKAMFGDKSLLKHYSEGKVIDAVALSEEAFNKMGYFEKDFIRSQLGEGKTKKDMLEALSTKGDMFLTTRFPRIQEGSDKVVMGYLDQTLKDNQIKALGHTGLSMNLDHDGDNFAVARVSNGDESYLKYINGDMANRSEYIASLETSVMERGSTINRYWDSKVRDKIAKEKEVAINGNRLSEIAKNKIIDGEIFSSIMDTKNMTMAEGYKILDKYSEFIDNDISNEDVVTRLKERYGSGTEAFENAKREYATAFSMNEYKKEMIAKSSKNAIGEVNVSNYKIKTMLTGLMDKTAEDYSYKSSLVYDMMHLSEEAAISAKSSTKGLDADRAKVWNENAMDLIKGKGNAEEHVANMKAWGQKYLMEDIDPEMYYSRSQAFREKVANTLGQSNLTQESFNSLMKDKNNKAQVQSMMINDFVETLDSLRQNNLGIEKGIDYLSLGHSSTGVTKSMFNPVTMEGFENVSDRVVKAIEQADSDINHNMKFFEIKDKIHSSKYSNASILDDIVSESDTYEKKKITEKVLEGTADMFKSVTGSKLAMGALGVAAGVMALGYVGGRPRPADTQAMEEAQDYPAPNLMDASMMQAMPNQGGQQGYIVNINARTDKGRDNAISAIQQALVNGSGTSINVSMNINDNYGNITDRDIEKIIKDAL